MAKSLPIPHLKQPSTSITTPNLEDKLTKQHETKDMLIPLHLSEQQVCPNIIKVSIGGHPFSLTALSIKISVVSLKITIHISLAYHQLVWEHHILNKQDKCE